MWPFKPNDWIPIFVESALYYVWDTIYRYKIEESKTTKTSVATLYYSKSRNKYKIIESGYIPTEGLECSNAYKACVNKQIELQNK
jgi:hypothetical protein